MTMTDDSLVLRVWLSLACTPGSLTFSHLRRDFGMLQTAEAAYRADEATLARALGKFKRDLPALLNKSLDRAERIVNFCRATGIDIIPYDDEHYPTPFLKLDDLPVLIYSRGKLPRFDERLCVGIVGTRSMTSYGKRSAFRIAYGLARVGVLIVSGMARGIDGVAAVGTLYGDGQTVAVLGSGMDVIYPPEHFALYKAITENGAVISEYPPGARPERHHFPIRNRLISALSDGVLVIEGDGGSGAMITATAAEKQGKRLFALPGEADKVTSEGPNLLIQQGAVAVTDADDILHAFSSDETKTTSSAMFSLIKKFRFTMIDRILRSYGVFCSVSAQEDEEGEGEVDARPAYTHVTYPQNKLGLRASTINKNQKTTEKEVSKSRIVLPKEGTVAYRVFHAISQTDGATADDVQGALPDVPFHQIVAAFTELEMSGVIEEGPGGRYFRASEK